MLKRKTNARANNMGDRSSTDPLYRVATQLKTLMALGMDTRKVSREKTTMANSLMPLVNMWWAQTSEPIAAMPMLESTIAL